MNFRAYHQQDDPLLICNVWDAASAKVAEKLKFKALGTSSAAMAQMLGYADGEDMTFAELKFFVERISATTRLPLSVDVEAGYSRDPQEIGQHLEALALLGVVGVNIEDSVVVQGQRCLLDAAEFAGTLAEVKQYLQARSIELFLNVRTDTVLLGQPNAIEEAKWRIAQYENAGIDGIFVPCLEKEDDIIAVLASTQLPLNIMCMPHLPDFQILKALGVKRISMGNILFDKMIGQLERSLTSITANGSFAPIF